VQGKRNEADFQRDKVYLRTLKQQEDDGKLMLYYFDESGFSTTPCVPYGWQRIGETRQIACHRSKRMNVLGFLNRSNELFFHTSEQSVTTDTVVNAFDAFVETYASKYQQTKVPCIVVLDNASIHRSRVFKEKMADWQQRGVCLHFLPPYSPELNLIEMLWRKVKYEWLPLDAYQSYGHLKKWVLEILGNVGEKFQITFA
jgi:transposase